MRPSPAQDGAEAACNITGISAMRPGLSVSLPFTRPRESFRVWCPYGAIFALPAFSQPDEARTVVLILQVLHLVTQGVCGRAGSTVQIVSALGFISVSSHSSCLLFLHMSYCQAEGSLTT